MPRKKDRTGRVDPDNRPEKRKPARGLEAWIMRVTRALELVSSVASQGDRRGMPSEVSTRAHQARAAISQLLSNDSDGGLRALEGSGWEPVTPTEKAIEVSEGDLVGIRKFNPGKEQDLIDRYAYIPEGVRDVLVVEKTIVQGLHVQALLRSRDGVPYGYVPRNHLTKVVVAK
jgi:hypothetical protein